MEARDVVLDSQAAPRPVAELRRKSLRSIGAPLWGQDTPVAGAWLCQCDELRGICSMGDVCGLHPIVRRRFDEVDE